MTSLQITLITGCNSGIGYETVRLFLQSDKAYHIIAGARSLEKANSVIDGLKKKIPNTANAIELLEIDLLNDSSIEKAFETVKAKHGHIDAFLNNASSSLGAAFQFDPSLRAQFTKTYDVNVASTHGWPKDPPFDFIAYQCSKVALNLLMIEWHFKLKEDGVKVWCVMSGLLATTLGGLGPEALEALGALHPRVGGEILKSVVEGERDVDVGKIVMHEGDIDW
ncbi:NAD(P)-binding protein [Lojkania enalia]|uniref:NAD(P)-binding protein n=1 Tax=Lojkania enalia TaxID=147567 RepID=A0A9P4TQ72_9PLEO|nr:NAD(P)-binding protein [Didymosphaeria enalia]